MIIRNAKIYDILKYISRYFLPALIVLFVAVADTLNLPYKVEVSAIGAAVITFLNTILGISNENYNKEKNAE